MRSPPAPLLFLNEDKSSSNVPLISTPATSMPPIISLASVLTPV
jgi:hypothetical protein